MTIAEYLASLAQQTGLDDASKAAMLKALENQKFAEALNKDVMASGDYSRNMDTLAKARTEFETTRKSWQDWYAEASARDAERERELVELRAKAGGTGGGAGGGTGGGTGGSGGGTGASTLTEKQLQEREGRMITIVKQMGRIASRHAANFHEELDVDAVEKIALEKGLTVEKAYDEYVRPRVEAAAKAANEAAIKKAHDDGVQEGLSKRDIPGEGERAFHPIFNRKPADAAQDPTKLSDSQRRQNFERTWNEAVTK